MWTMDKSKANQVNSQKVAKNIQVFFFFFFFLTPCEAPVNSSITYSSLDKCGSQQT